MAQSDNLDGYEDPDPNGIKTVAILYKNMFDELMNVGFRRSEAAQLTCAFIAAAAMGD